MKKRILGLDPGLATLGFGIIDCQYNQDQSEILETTLIDFGVIKTPAKQKMGIRLQTIYDDLHTIIREFKPDLAGTEKLFFYKMGNVILVAQARGVLTLVLSQCQLDCVEFTPAQIKQALTGHGNAEKLEVQEAVARQFDLAKIPRPDDAADALAIALTTAWSIL